jgi:NO-binding membrane sensor protein with MHYT domain/GAF domain-containing protein/HAMP domain-containing protein
MPDFLHSHQLATILPHAHNTVLVALSIVIAILASYTALDMAAQVALRRGRERYIWLVGGAIAMGTGIWSMHFVAMLAFQLPVPVSYDVTLVLASWVTAVVASGLALEITSQTRVGVPQIVVGGTVMGIAIAGMHYIGMEAMRGPFILRYEVIPFVLSIAIAIGASMAALWLQFRLRAATARRDLVWKVLAAVVMGFAIASMHYTGMFGSIFIADETVPATLPGAIQISVLGWAAIAVGALVSIYGLLLLRWLASTLAFKNLRIGTKLSMLIAIGVVGLAGFAAYAFYVLGIVQVNGPLYLRLAQGQVLVTDILPPPAYIIESYLIPLQMLDAAEDNNTALVNGLIERSSSLEHEYEARHEYWTDTLTENGNNEVRQSLLVDSYQPAREFYRAFKEEFVPAIQAGHLDEAHTILHETLTPAYDAHRAALDQVVQLQRAAIQENESSAQSLVSSSTTLLIILGLLTAILAIALGVYVANSVITPVSQLTLVAGQITSGNLWARALADSTDEIGILSRAFNQMTAQLRDNLSGLEQRVAERTADLEISRQQTEKRAQELQTISEISRLISTEQRPDILLPLITRLVSERFDFYHVGIFLIDNAQQFAVLQAANSEGGQRMLERGHKLEVGQTGIVGNVAQTAKTRIALDVGLDAVYFDNPDLPNTRSEMALPLNLRGQTTVGVLDVQSLKPGAFNESDANTLGILADHIAVTIDNARLFEQSRLALSEVQTLYRQYQAQEWDTFMKQETKIGYHQLSIGGKVLEQLHESDEIQNVMERGEILVVNSKLGESESSMVVPVKLRGQIIGVLNIKAPTTNRTWNQDEINLAEAISDRLALALDNARLLQDSQRRAAKEQKIGDVTAKIGASINMRSMLQTAVEELGRALPGSEVVIQFESDGK